MVFSLFSRKDRSEPRKPRDGAVVVDSVTGPDGSLQAAREAARRTAEKIDRIESEMIKAPPAAVPATARSAPVPAAPAAALAPPPADVAMRPPADPMQHSTSVVLGDTAGAMAIDVNGSSLPPLLEEAAILFANGQAGAAVDTLKHAISETPTAGFETLAWRMLFDLYQVTDQQAGFDSLGIDFAARFGTPPPTWRAPAGLDADARGRTGGDAGAGHLDASAVDALLAGLRRQLDAKDPAAVLDFRGVSTVDAAAGERLHVAFRELCATSAAFTLHGAADLFAAARAGIETGRRDPSEGLWMLTLLALRMLGEQQGFEDLSIDYCVTYEVSPPPWVPMPASIVCEAGAPSAARQEPLATAPLAEPAPGAFVFRNELKGRAPPELKALREHAADRSDVVVDCRALARLDFVAAGELLNEVVSLRSAGKQLLFVEPNSLVYGLMLVMGIHELAEVRRRKE